MRKESSSNRHPDQQRGNVVRYARERHLSFRSQKPVRCECLESHRINTTVHPTPPQILTTYDREPHIR